MASVTIRNLDDDVVVSGSCCDPFVPEEKFLVRQTGDFVSRRVVGGDERVLFNWRQGSIEDERFGDSLVVARRPGQENVIYFASHRIWKFHDTRQTQRLPL